MFSFIGPGRVEFAGLQAKISKFALFLPKNDPRSELIINSVPVHTITKPHVPYFSFIGPGRVEFAGLQANNSQIYQNFTFSPFLHKNDPRSALKEIAFLYTPLQRPLTPDVQLHRAQAGWSLLDYKQKCQHFTFSPFLPKNDPRSAPKEIAFLYTHVIRSPHHTRFSASSAQAGWSLLDYKQKYQNFTFSHFCPKMTPDLHQKK